MLTQAREQLAAKNTLLAQLGFLGAAARFFDAGEPAKATAVLEEVRKAIPDAGVIPELYRRRFEYYLGLGAPGARDAALVGKQYQSDALRGAWSSGFVAQAELFLVLAEPDRADFQGKLRAVVASADAHPLIANRARIELAHCLRKNKDFEAARSIYDEVQHRDGVDADSRAGALLGLGLLLLDQAKTPDPAVFKQALLLFLRVRLETREARSLHAEALYHAIVAADKWRGPEYTSIMGRCRRQLLDEFPSTQWAKLAKDGF
jgi:tetratricopeptide (TPR) repeat protein